MRNPTVSIKTGIEQVIYNSGQIKKLHKSFKEFQGMVKQVVEGEHGPQIDSKSKP